MTFNKVKAPAQVVLAVSISLAIVFANWFLVDPLHVRALPNLLRYLFTGVVGIVLGGLIYISLRAALPRLSSFRHWQVSLTVLIVVVILFFVLPLKPAPNRFSVSRLEILVSGQPVELHLNSILVGSKVLPFSQCNQEGDWQAVGAILVVPPEGKGRISCILNVPAKTSIDVGFNATTQTASVEVSLDSKVQNVYLNTSQNSPEVYVHLVGSYKIGDLLAILMRLVDALFIILLGYGVGQLDRHYLGSENGRQMITTAPGFQAWFDETTPRFQWVMIIGGGLTSLMTAFLFLQPVFSNGIRMPPGYMGAQAKPNIIFIVVDALAAKDMSMFGYSVLTTPKLEDITQTWSVYANAQSPLTCTVMSLPTFMTGRYPYTSDYASYGDMTSSEAGWSSLPQVLKEAGYQTWWSGYLSPGFYHLGSGFENTVCRSDNVLHKALSRSWFQIQAISKTYFPFIPLTLDQMNVVTESQEDLDTCEELDSLTSLIQTPSVKAPFFIYYHYRGVHGIPYRSGSYLGAFLPEEYGLLSFEDQSRVYGGYNLAEQPLVDMLRLRYDEAIANQDENLSDFIGFLKKQGLYDSSMIIITADHGQSFSNGYSSHCTPLVSYAEAHVPLLIKYPNQIQGQRFNELVSTVDITPTILDAAGFKYPENWFDGGSLLRETVNPDSNRIVFTRQATYGQGLPSNLAVTDGQYRLVMRNSKLFLFNIIRDPEESHNLIEQSGILDLPEIQKLKQAIDNYIHRAQLLTQRIGILDMPPLEP